MSPSEKRDELRAEVLRELGMGADECPSAQLLLMSAIAGGLAEASQRFVEAAGLPPFQVINILLNATAGQVAAYNTAMRERGLPILETAKCAIVLEEMIDAHSIRQEAKRDR